ncbi:hypothetical protein E2C01_074747 [Portunus trituberculatus]|uniref:Uncharacterized protein n=1 Tax=Portunus trituberculatus TaxID=210409 RepID=A0A5B7IF35_PORTR|nr:hypothetical protein [Portunus trituberculatus]
MILRPSLRASRVHSPLPPTPLTTTHPLLLQLITTTNTSVTTTTATTIITTHSPTSPTLSLQFTTHLHHSQSPLTHHHHYHHHREGSRWPSVCRTGWCCRCHQQSPTCWGSLRTC